MTAAVEQVVDVVAGLCRVKVRISSRAQALVGVRAIDINEVPTCIKINIWTRRIVVTLDYLHIVEGKVPSKARPGRVHELEPLCACAPNTHACTFPASALVAALRPNGSVARAAVTRPLQQHHAHVGSVP